MKLLGVHVIVAHVNARQSFPTINAVPLFDKLTTASEVGCQETQTILPIT